MFIIVTIVKLMFRWVLRVQNVEELKLKMISRLNHKPWNK